VVVILEPFFLYKGNGYRIACGSSYLKPYSSTSYNVTVTHDESVVGLVETY